MAELKKESQYPEIKVTNYRTVLNEYIYQKYIRLGVLNGLDRMIIQAALRATRAITYLQVVQNESSNLQRPV